MNEKRETKQSTWIALIAIVVIAYLVFSQEVNIFKNQVLSGSQCTTLEYPVYRDGRCYRF